MKYLDYAHTKYQAFLKGHGMAVDGHHVGQCWWFFQLRGELLGIVAFSDVPEPWQAMVNEYHALRTKAITVIEPINVVCQNGGGNISDEDDRKILDLFDLAQDRTYKLLQQAKSMVQ